MNNLMTQRARALRQSQTPQEQELWRELRAKRFSGFKFRRQAPIGRYIVDFVCFDKKVIIELDGSQHQDNQTYDAARDQWLAEQGFTVLRFWNNQWTQQREAVLEAIWRALHPLPNPSPIEGEGLNATSSSNTTCWKSSNRTLIEEEGLNATSSKFSPAGTAPDAASPKSPLSPSGRGDGGLLLGGDCCASSDSPLSPSGRGAGGEGEEGAEE